MFASGPGIGMHSILRPGYAGGKRQRAANDNVMECR